MSRSRRRGVSAPKAAARKRAQSSGDARSARRALRRLLDAFDAIVIVALEPDAVATLCRPAARVRAAAGHAAIIVVLAQATAPGAHASCARAPMRTRPAYSFIELHERMVALHRLAAREGALQATAPLRCRCGSARSRTNSWRTASA